MPTLCRDCATGYATDVPLSECPGCGSTRQISHTELACLSIAHIDCDAFYASVEKRDDPSLRGKPVIVGGGHRGVVAACCYVARIKGVRSAMPMFEARKRCPEAVVIPPNLEKYRIAGHAVRALMSEVTPLVEPISIDEAFLDLRGTEKLHRASPAQTLIKLVNRIEAEVGVSASVGLSYNKFLAKVASDLDKPRGFSVVGKSEALAFLADKPVGLLWGVGKVLQKNLARDGIDTIGQLRHFDESGLVKRYGSMGQRLFHFSRGEDSRAIEPQSETKSISAETTFATDLNDPEELLNILWRLSEKVSGRLKAADYAGGGITLKLKLSDFKQITRSRVLASPTQMADALFRHARDLLQPELKNRKFRLLGIGATRLCSPNQADRPDLLDPKQQDRLDIERAMDAVRKRFGGDAIVKGRSLDRQK
ncbi:MAG: DNA polymerase IV [Rhodospirillales bacterium]|nr:DNA polymerase IV [Rhodospirillales bacterium]